MSSSEFSPSNFPSSEELIREELAYPIAEHYRNDVYRDIIDALVREQKTFDEVCAALAPLEIPGLDTIETAEAYQTLLDRLVPGKKVIFQLHGKDLPGAIGHGSVPAMRIETILLQGEPYAAALFDIPIECDGETEVLPFYPRRSQESGEMIIPGLTLRP